MYVKLSTLIVESTHISFVNNNRAVLLYMSTLNITTSNMTFVGNAIKRSVGGALYIYNSTIDIQFSLLTFVNNSATSGGAIYSKSSKLSFGHSTGVVFRHNLAKGLKEYGSKGVGGAVDITYSTLIVEHNSNLSFVNNNASLQGGAIYAHNLSNVTVNGASSLTFIMNSALNRYSMSSGGAIYVRESSLYVGIGSSVLFIGNSAESEGGGVFFLLSKLSLEDETNMSFVGNAAARGGAIAFTSSQMEFLSSTLQTCFLKIIPHGSLEEQSTLALIDYSL